ncbi:hypothetical protein KEB92_001473 [Listeria monocytogenes]|nr:hypothetical protein [Listeria monocytogenes]EAW7187111.1 hypothetical protein [Listeria monocytogenes]EHL5789016.1 hypothetical protein [Listeria monocytogenes]EIA8551422.1 hypothetical protein [Listeria monocytogenes]EIM0150366.1 hypothetical protein [Listeria monocytogenes]
MSLAPVIDTTGNILILVDQKKRYTYNKNPTTGTLEKTDEFVHVYSIVCIERKFEKIDVKIDEKKPLYPFDEKGKVVGLPDNVQIEFENLVITPWVDKNGRIQLSATANSCFVIQDED